jgi:hypothetical protein
VFRFIYLKRISDRGFVRNNKEKFFQRAVTRTRAFPMGQH